MTFQAWRSRWKIAGLGGLCLVALAAAGIMLRKPLAGWAAEAYFARLGIPSSVDVTRLDLSGLSAGLRLGTAQTAITAERIDIELARLAPRPEISALRIVRPAARFTYTSDGLALGPLQRLMEAFSESTGASSAPPPIPVTVEDAAITLDTAAGGLVLRGNAAFLGDTLKNLDVASNDAALRLDTISGQVRAFRLRVTETSTGLNVSARARGDVSYDSASGPVTLKGLNVTIDAPRIRLVRTDDILRIDADALDITTTTDTAQALTDTLQDLRFSARGSRAAIVRDEQGVSLSGAMALDLAVGGGDLGGFILRKTTAHLEGSARLGSTIGFNIGAKVDIDGGLTDARIQDAIEPLAALSTSERKALSDILHEFTVEAPALTLSGKGGAIAVTLDQPVTVAGAYKSRAVLSASGTGPLVAMENGTARGALQLTFAGTSLPAVDLTLSSYSFAKKPDVAVRADAALSVRGSIAGLRGVSLTTSGTLAVQGRNFSYAPQRCASLAVSDARPTGESVMRDATALICPREGVDFLRGEDGILRLSGLWSKVGAQIPAAQIQLDDAAGDFDITLDPHGEIQGDVKLRDALLSDGSDTARFSPLRATGDTQLRQGQWRAKFALATGDRRQTLGTVALTHAPNTGRGEARLDVQGIAFTPDRLQPADLASSLEIFENATGQLAFTGRVAWGGDSLVSEGTLGLHDLGFASPAGVLSGIRGALRFDSLLPLSSPRGQKLEISRIDWVMPITDTALEFSFDANKLQVTSATAKMADGAVAIDPFTIDLSTEPSLRSAMRLRDIDLGPVVAGTNFADRVQLAVKVQGVVPFSLAASGIQFQKGTLQSVGPGRLSISRGLWTGPDQPPVNAVQDFAYQAMEHLAVDELTGQINSLDENRLGLVLRIKGRHDPANPAVTQLGLFSLLKGEAFDTPVPLPAKTPVDLTLDMSLNFGELLRAYGEAFAQLKNSAP
jgi:hypothetical protein